ncbi:Uu.00g008640.m01.CDS01 [Anthostomella pinea]|uniref:Uu.00g008640.m01.CDS01 n=1 Tax=Anthostomella pinea TaxID=933095 RepID=A0AAI8VXV9_9PEZI|nr:Uu.00g008640.m01.CDS01 [Anthostomella pinea]
MQFPPEVADQITTYLYSTVPLCHGFALGEYNGDRRDQWTDFISCDYQPVAKVPKGPDDKRRGQTRRRRSPSSAFIGNEIDFQSLLNLRLVSRAWHASASNTLAKLMDWSLCFESEVSWVKAAACFPPLNASFSHYVRSLNIKEVAHVRSFLREHHYDPSAFEGQDVTREHMLLNNYRELAQNIDTDTHGIVADDNSPLRYDKRAENVMLRRIFDSLVRLERFSISFRGALCDADYGHNAECYDLEALDDVMASVAHGLRSPAFQHLVDLRLQVPCTHDVAVLAEAMSQEARDRLKHLRLKIVDATGPSGDRSYLHEWEQQYITNNHSYQDGALTMADNCVYTPSNLQTKYPNREHQGGLWALVRSCHNLESLGIESTHYLSLDRLDWKKGPGSKGLKALALRRVWTDIDSIMKLLSLDTGSDFSQSSIRRLDFSDVKVYKDGGTWSTLFEALVENGPDLEWFPMSNLSYFSTHHDDDREKMGDLVGALIRKAGGQRGYPFEHCNYDADD